MRSPGWLIAAALGAVGVGIGVGVSMGVQTADAAAQVRVTPEQLLINQRISQAGVRRSNLALQLLAPVNAQPGQPAPPGWATTQIANGAITPQKLANPNLFAVVAGATPPTATTLVRGSGATGVTRVSEGRFAVVFNRAVTACAYAATAGDPGTAAATPAAASVAGQPGNPNGVSSAWPGSAARPAAMPSTHRSTCRSTAEPAGLPVRIGHLAVCVTAKWP